MLSTQAIQTRPCGFLPTRIQLVTLNCSADQWNSCTYSSNTCYLCVVALAAAHRGLTRRLKSGPPTALRPLTFSWDWGLWHLCGQRKRRCERRWRRLDLSFCLPPKCPAAAEVKGLTFGPVGLLRAVDPCDRPLDPAYPWARGAFCGPGPCGCSPSFHHKPGVRTGQGRTNEVRAVMLGDLCPSAAPIAFWPRE